MRKSTCPRCGDTFAQPPGKGRNRKYCRPDCGDETSTCEECLTDFSGPPGKRYCSDPCRFKGMAKRNRSDPAAQAVRGKLGGAVRGAQIKALGTRPDVYLKEGGEHVHRIVAESVLGRPLAPGEVVHHEDQVKHNNHPSNLIVFPSQGDHFRHHQLGHCLKPCSCPGIRLKELL